MSIEFLVPDMSCGHCVKTITAAVQAVEPQAQVQADLGTHRVRIDGAATPGPLRQAIEEAGYTAQDPA
ncbi:heavy-metal-associated domain-containing protein [Bordetella sp. 2513F-2]